MNHDLERSSNLLIDETPSASVSARGPSADLKEPSIVAKKSEST
jgi:hypothetical protein